MPTTNAPSSNASAAAAPATPSSSAVAPIASQVASASPAREASSAAPAASAAPAEVPSVEVDSPLLGHVRRPVAAAPPTPANAEDATIPGAPAFRARITPDPSRLGGARITLPFNMSPKVKGAAAVSSARPHGPARPPVARRGAAAAAPSTTAAPSAAPLLAPSIAPPIAPTPSPAAPSSDPKPTSANPLDEANAKLSALMNNNH
jgi:hypothetical protein